LFIILTTILKTENLTKKYSSVLAVDNLCFGLEKGTITALLGGNGAGKTTTLSMLLGLLEPTSGSIRLFDQDFIRNRYSVLDKMNFSSPYVDLPQRLTVRENLTVYAKLYGVSNLGERIQQVSQEFRLDELLDRKVRKLSSGQKTRVSLAKALINRPKFLLLDEPTASLDPDTTSWIRDFLRNYRDTNDATILFASHDMREVELLCDDVLLMKSGKLVEKGSPSTLLDKYDRENLEQVFLQLSREGEEQ
jgi:ABC-2 type transport system ATP-binding protein